MWFFEEENWKLTQNYQALKIINKLYCGG